MPRRTEYFQHFLPFALTNGHRATIKMPAVATTRPIRVPDQGPPKDPKQSKRLTRSLKRKRDEAILAGLENAVQTFDSKICTLFSELPLTRRTAFALDKSHFKAL